MWQPKKSSKDHPRPGSPSPESSKHPILKTPIHQAWEDARPGRPDSNSGFLTLTSPSTSSTTSRQSGSPTSQTSGRVPHDNSSSVHLRSPRTETPQVERSAPAPSSKDPFGSQAGSPSPRRPSGSTPRPPSRDSVENQAGLPPSRRPSASAPAPSSKDPAGSQVGPTPPPSRRSSRVYPPPGFRAPGDPEITAPHRAAHKQKKKWKKGWRGVARSFFRWSTILLALFSISVLLIILIEYYFESPIRNTIKNKVHHEWEEIQGHHMDLVSKAKRKFALYECKFHMEAKPESCDSYWRIPGRMRGDQRFCRAKIERLRDDCTKLFEDSRKKVTLNWDMIVFELFVARPIGWLIRTVSGYLVSDLAWDHLDWFNDNVPNIPRAYG